METVDIISLARKHSLKSDVACPDFFEGALLGNGDLGAVVCTRPDAIVIHFGHNNIWDIRLDESNKDELGTFNEIFSKILSEKDNFRDQEWYREYEKMARASYSKPYPRPYPASSLFLFFDRMEYWVLGHELDISRGLLTVALQGRHGKKYYIKVLISQRTDIMLCQTVDENGNPASVFHRMRLLPHKPYEGIPDYTVLENGFVQILPHNEFAGTIRPNEDKGFSVLYKMNGNADANGLGANLSEVTEIKVRITQGYYNDVEPIKDFSDIAFYDELAVSEKIWRDYWQCSGVQLEDDFLEHIWYTNTYFLRCALNEHCRCPGLFANWSYENIGTAWHGDYHMNYNTQQPFWGIMGANRCNLHMPYVRLTEELLPVAKSWANDYYQLSGAYFPHSAYPVPMTINPYPTTTWGWEVCETPWTVQSLWWHYTYTKDKELLRTRLYPIMREAASFLASYMMRTGSNPKGDDKYHLYPIIVPELYGLCNKLDRNLDGTCDLAFTKFLFGAILEAASELGIEKEEADLIGKIKLILSDFPEYPTAQSRYGEVYISVGGEDPDSVIYNVPSNLTQIFPCGEIDAQSGTESDLEIARRSWEHHYNEGGNDIVFYYLIGARLGVIDLERFKMHVRYCMLPNGTVTDRATLSGGRYKDDMNCDFMSRMGIWFENFALYAVIDECLIWGHNDVVELFPNWDMNKKASFCSMRTKGAFLVSADCSGGRVNKATVYSEQGGVFRMKNPWDKAMDNNGMIYTEKIIRTNMNKGCQITFTEA